MVFVVGRGDGEGPTVGELGGPLDRETSALNIKSLSKTMIKICVCIAIILLQHEARISQSLPGCLVISPRQPLENFLELQPKMNNEEQYHLGDR